MDRHGEVVLNVGNQTLKRDGPRRRSVAGKGPVGHQLGMDETWIAELEGGDARAPLGNAVGNNIGPDSQ
jgi:hypothetical protein